MVQSAAFAIIGDLSSSSLTLVKSYIYIPDTGFEHHLVTVEHATQQLFFVGYSWPGVIHKRSYEKLYLKIEFDQHESALIWILFCIEYLLCLHSYVIKLLLVHYLMSIPVSTAKDLYKAYLRPYRSYVLLWIAFFTGLGSIELDVDDTINAHLVLGVGPRIRRRRHLVWVVK